VRYLDDPDRDGFVTDICCHAGDAAVPFLNAAFAFDECRAAFWKNHLCVFCVAANPPPLPSILLS
jgi:hypothetical protein